MKFMKRNFVFMIALALGLISLSASAELHKPRLLQSPYDVVAPSLGGDPDVNDRVVGQIYYDASESAFKGVNKDGGVDIIAHSNRDAVTTLGTEAIFRARIANNGATASVISQSGSWISSVARNGTGDVTINFAADTFSETPACVCTLESGSNASDCVHLATPGTASARIGSGVDTTFAIICMGAP